MTITILQIVITCIFAAAALANYIVLLSINLKISQLNGTIKEWSRENFAEKEHLHAVQNHLLAVDTRVQRLERNHQIK